MAIAELTMKITYQSPDCMSLAVELTGSLCVLHLFTIGWLFSDVATGTFVENDSLVDEIINAIKTVYNRDSSYSNLRSRSFTISILAPVDRSKRY
ncbi:hypothetical protein I4U23_013142 [Adineta vaga]|nr:hypothetical protein I4U23_013142 [Adineta vaga]